METAQLTKESALKIACGMELAEKGVHKLKEENPTEATVDLVGTAAKHKKSRRTKWIQRKLTKRKKIITIHISSSKFSKYNHNKRINFKSNDIVCYRYGQAHFASKLYPSSDRKMQRMRRFRAFAKSL